MMVRCSRDASGSFLFGSYGREYSGLLEMHTLDNRMNGRSNGIHGQ